MRLDGKQSDVSGGRWELQAEIRNEIREGRDHLCPLGGSAVG